jgi:hypothetical protein
MNEENIEKDEAIDVEEAFVYNFNSKVLWFHPSKEELEQISKKHYIHLDSKEKDELLAIKEQERKIKHDEYLQSRIIEIRRNLARDLIDSFVEEKYAQKTVQEKTQLKTLLLKRLIALEYDAHSEDEIRTIIEEAASGNKSNDETKPYLKVLGYLWRVFINIVVICFIFGILGSTYDDGQKIIYCILILIYLSVKGGQLGLGLTYIRTALSLDFEFKRIRTLLKATADNEETKKTEEAQKLLDKTTIGAAIDGVFASIAYIIVIWNLYNSL